MIKIFTKKVLTISIIVICSFSILGFFAGHNWDEGLRKFEYNLLDGQSIEIDSILVDKEKDLITLNSLPDINTAILRSFETEHNSLKDLKMYIADISQYRDIGYWKIIPNYSVSHAVYSLQGEKKENNFMAFYHKIFRNKSARTFLFNKALEYVSNECKKNPSDYHRNIINELKNLILFTKTIQLTKKKINTDDLEDYWKGFIYRRFSIDNVPISEINSSLNYALEIIQKIDTSNQPNFMYEYTINKNIVLLISSDEYSVASKISRRKYSFPKNVSVRNIKYFVDETGNYYKISALENGILKNGLFDEELNMIK